MNKHTDLELTRICSEWLGWKRGFGTLRIGGKDFSDKYWWDKNKKIVAAFDPLHNDNDLWKRVIPKLPKRYVVCICGGTYDLYDSESKCPIPSRGDVSNLPRAVLELVAEIAEKEAKDENHPKDS